MVLEQFKENKYVEHKTNSIVQIKDKYYYNDEKGCLHCVCSHFGTTGSHCTISFCTQSTNNASNSEQTTKSLQNNKTQKPKPILRNQPYQTILRRDRIKDYHKNNSDSSSDCAELSDSSWEPYTWTDSEDETNKSINTTIQTTNTKQNSNKNTFHNVIKKIQTTNTEKNNNTNTFYNVIQNTTDRFQNVIQNTTDRFQNVIQICLVLLRTLLINIWYFLTKYIL